ncbi:MAG: hypothetical protein ACM3PP_02090 [Candidatus Saccharibacteria bacterium]
MNYALVLALCLLVYLIEDRYKLRSRYQEWSKNYNLIFDLFMMLCIIGLEMGFVYLTLGYITETVRIIVCAITFVYLIYIIAPSFRRPEGN